MPSGSGSAPRWLSKYVQFVTNALPLFLCAYSVVKCSFGSWSSPQVDPDWSFKITKSIFCSHTSFAWNGTVVAAAGTVVGSCVVVTVVVLELVLIVVGVVVVVVVVRVVVVVVVVVVVAVVVVVGHQLPVTQVLLALQVGFTL